MVKSLTNQEYNAEIGEIANLLGLYPTDIIRYLAHAENAQRILAEAVAARGAEREYVVLAA